MKGEVATLRQVLHELEASANHYFENVLTSHNVTVHRLKKGTTTLANTVHNENETRNIDI